VTSPKFPFLASHTAPEDASRRQRLARWITSPDNQYFASSYVNRIWGYLLGKGLIDPLDDIRAGNPPSNPELLQWLTQHFVESHFSAQDLIRTICKSRTYQLSIKTNQWNEDDKLNYSHAVARRLPAEVLFDAIHYVAGSTSKIPGVPAGTRAAELVDSGVKIDSGFLQNLGRPARESACECERSAGLQLGPVMALVSGPTLNGAISDPENELAKLAGSDLKESDLVSEIFMRILNRPATNEEISAGVSTLQSIAGEHEALLENLARYQEKLEPITAQKELDRLETIEKTKAKLIAYEKELAPRLAEMNKKKLQHTEKLQADLVEYDKTLPDKLVLWEAEKSPLRTVWMPLRANELTSTFGAKLTQESDLSIIASEKNGVGSYKLIAQTDLIGITAIRLELLTDERLPKNGPGRAGSGNCVLTELELTAASVENPDTSIRVKLQNAKANFSQGGYEVNEAIDDSLATDGNGWAIAPKMGENHVATFELAEPIGERQGTLLSFELKQLLSEKSHSIGKFRLSITTSPRPVEFEGIPPNIVNLLVSAAEKRNAKQQENLLAYFQMVDVEREKRVAAIDNSMQPLPIDPTLKNVQEELAYVSLPLAKDGKLERLERAVEISSKHVKNWRLTGAQDIAWALINSSAFLFNR
jgi:hypothetical protein